MKPCPGRHSDETFEIAFAEFWPRLEEFLEGTEDDPTDPRWKESARQILHNNFNEDGYQLAKDFEDRLWPVNTEFVEVADEWSHCLFHGHRKAREAWVISEGIVPKLALGAKVKFESRKSYRTEVLIGEITEINTKTGDYTVFCESLGHVRPGSVKNGMGVTGLYVGFHDLERLNEVQHG